MPRDVVRWVAMSTPQPPPGQPEYVPVHPLLPDDPPKIGGFWLDARLTAGPSGVVYTGHGPHPTDRTAPAEVPVMIVLLSEGAAGDAAARDRFAGVVNAMHIDTVLARGGEGQDTGRLGRRYQSDDDDPVTPDGHPAAPWAALAYDGSPAAAAEAQRVLDEVTLATLPMQGQPSGPDYRLYWIDRIKPGLARLWPLPWPGRYDRAGWVSILISWLLMMLLAALAVLIAILIFRNQPPQSPPPPIPPTASPPPSGSPPPSSGSPPPSSGSPPPSSGSPSPSSGSPSPSSGSPSPSSGSPSPSEGSPSPSEGSPSQTPSMSGSPSPGQTGGPTPSESGGGTPSPRSRL
ncbi:hypothetical protein GCM10028864_44040 [Microlunatus parietis]